LRSGKGSPGQMVRVSDEETVAGYVHFRSCCASRNRIGCHEYSIGLKTPWLKLGNATCATRQSSKVAAIPH